MYIISFVRFRERVKLRKWVVGEGVKRGGFEGGKRGWNGVGVIDLL